MGNAPLFAASVAPRRYTVRFDSGETLTYSDYIAVGNSRYAYFRFAQGVASGGTSLSRCRPKS
jgi:hypothetical protein